MTIGCRLFRPGNESKNHSKFILKDHVNYLRQEVDYLAHKTLAVKKAKGGYAGGEQKCAGIAVRMLFRPIARGGELRGGAGMIKDMKVV